MERRERQIPLANAELEGGQVNSGCRRNVVRGVSFVYVASNRVYTFLEGEHLPVRMMWTLSLVDTGKYHESRCLLAPFETPDAFTQR